MRIKRIYIYNKKSCANYRLSKIEEAHELFMRPYQLLALFIQFDIFNEVSLFQSD